MRSQARRHRLGVVGVALLLAAASAEQSSAAAVPIRARNGMVVSQNGLAAQVGAAMLVSGGSAMDAAIATAFALAVVHPAAGNIGGGGFLVYRPARGRPMAYDFRETAPAAASPGMFLGPDGRYDAARHHESPLAVGVPGTVAGLYLAWQDAGRLPWEQLLEPAIALAKEGFVVSDGLSRSLRAVLPEMAAYPASLRQFSRDGLSYQMGDLLRQPDLAETLERIAKNGPDGFYDGKVAEAIEKEMRARGGLITRADLKGYRARRRAPLRGTYRDYEILTMPPPTSGGVLLIEMLNVLEGWDVPGFGSAEQVHRLAETMRRAYADRARYLADPDFVRDMPLARLLSKEYAATLRESIGPRASVSSPGAFEWPRQGRETTHVSVVDTDRNAVALTTTLEEGYGSKIVVTGAGFLLNNEMGDFNAGPGLTDATGLIGTPPNLAAPGKRMLSSMTPTIVVRGHAPFLVVGTPGGRTIPNTVLQVILNVLDFGMNVQEAIDAPRVHHQWLPDVIGHERWGLSPDTLALLAERGHRLESIERQGVVEGILVDAYERLLEGGYDRRAPDGAAVGQ